MSKLTPQLVKNKNVLLRADLDVSVVDGQVAGDFRLQTLLPTLQLLSQNAKTIVIIGHKGRPTQINTEDSLLPVKRWLEQALNQSISFVSSGFTPGEWVGESPTQISLLENLRFDPREQGNDRDFAVGLAKGFDIYVYEAFASYNTAASLHKIPEILPTVPGLRFELEVESLSKSLNSVSRPSLLLISGAKADKVSLVNTLSSKFDECLVGGKLATLVVPVCIPGKTCVTPASLTDDGLDISIGSTHQFLDKISRAKTIVLNGPLGKFEDGQHYLATKTIFTAVKNSKSYNILGGGDTLAALDQLGFSYSDFSFVSTGGGAMLEYLATGTHPLLEVLKIYTKNS